jgi:hypothetical protein
MKAPSHSPRGNFYPGQEIDIDAGVARGWIEAGIAEPLRGPVVERAVVESAAEEAVAAPRKKKRASKKRSTKKE